MEYLFNELSIHGQFNSAGEFVNAVKTIMNMREKIRRAGRELSCTQKLTTAMVTPAIPMSQAVQSMPIEQRIPWVQWITQTGPFWEEQQTHGDGDWLDVENDEIVTGSTCGEAAFCELHGLPRELVSISPSKWLKSPIVVTWRTSAFDRTANVKNHWLEPTIVESLSKLELPFDSWQTLEGFAHRAFARLRFTVDAFDELAAHPFVPGAAERIIVCLDVLNKMLGYFDEDTGERTAEGDEMYAKFFTGKKALFSRSGDGEMNDFESELTFPHPTNPGQKLMCPWHGKIKINQIRVHFTWPIAFGVPLYVVYVGPKLTRR